VEAYVLHELQKHLSVLDNTIEATPWRDRMVYGAFLSQTYYYVSHSTRLLALAASRLAFSEERLHRRLLRHATEEMGHEALALRDLRHLGLALDQFPELPATRAFYQTQYYLIEHVSPASFWGYILMLEGLAVSKGRWLFDEIKQHHGELAGSFVKLHAVEDVAHVAEAEQAMQALPDRDRPLVVAQVASSCFYYCSMLAECTAYANEHASPAIV
jgi:thiaminase